MAIHLSRMLATTGGQSLAGPSVPGLPKVIRVSDVLIERISRTYSRVDAGRDDIAYWPEPLPTPENARRPDPLVLFQRAGDAVSTERIALVPLDVQEIVGRRRREGLKPLMQIPLGLMDKPEVQLREILLLDLHGGAGVLAGGPLLLLGAQNSGKGTALQTILLWLTARYLPSQFKCAVLDPNHDVEAFRDLPHFYDEAGNSLWTDGSSDEEVAQFANRSLALLTKRQERYPQQRWNEETLGQLWAQGAEVPLILLIISHYQRFVERVPAASVLKKLAVIAAEARALGAYLVVTASEVGTNHLPGELINKMGTKIGLTLNKQQQAEVFGRSYAVLDAVPGRGLLQNRARQIQQVQLALPTMGANEPERYETLRSALRWCGKI